MVECIRVYHQSLPGLAEDLVRNGSLALMLIDISPFIAIEEQYGTQTYSLVRQRLYDLIEDRAGQDYPKENVLALDDPGGLRILIFLDPDQHATPIFYDHLEALRIRMMRSLVPKLQRTAFPYLKNPPRISIGYALGICNSLVDPNHTILRIIREALERAEWQHHTEEMENMYQLRDLILKEKVRTLYQPIVSLADGKPFGFEALSRGAADSAFHSANDLFDSAIRHHLLVELDRVCRNRAVLYSNRIPGNAKLFVNTLPATMRDPEFQGQHLISMLERARINPDRIVIEITEKMVIDNLSLFQDAMSYFTDLGMSLAVDDVGSGYSGLETVGKLKPSYLKIDMALVHDVHTSMVNREILKGILLLGRGMGAEVIAEGIENAEELETVRAIGCEYGQGYLFGKPSEMLKEKV